MYWRSISISYYLRLYDIAASLRLIQSNRLAFFFAHGALIEFLSTLLAYTQVTAILKQVSSDEVFANYALRLFQEFLKAFLKRFLLVAQRFGLV